LEACALLAAVVLGAAPFGVAPAGDGGGVAVTVANRNVHPASVELGGAASSIAGFGESVFYLHCAGEAPPVPALRMAGASHPMEVSPTSFPDGPPALWISAARRGRAALEAIVRPASGVGVRHLSLAEVPATFAAMRFAPLLLVSATDLAALPAASRAAIRGAVAVGSTLVVGAGEGTVPRTALEGFGPARLGERVAPGPALGAALPEVTAAARLTGADPLVVADGSPVVVESTIGLGRVRVLAVDLSVASGRVAEAAFRADDREVVRMLSWIDQAPPLASGGRTVFAAHVWGLLALLALLGLLARRWPRVGLALCLPWLAVGAAVPPVADVTEVEAARVIYRSAGDVAVAAGSVDVRLGVGGAVHLAVPTGVVAALEDAPRGGACLSQGQTSAWTVTGAPGDRRRITFFALVPSPKDGDAPLPIAVRPRHTETSVAAPEAPRRPAPIQLDAPPPPTPPSN